MYTDTQVAQGTGSISKVKQPPCLMFSLPKTVEYTVHEVVFHIVVYILISSPHRMILRTLYSAVFSAVCCTLRSWVHQIFTH